MVGGFARAAALNGRSRIEGMNQIMFAICIVKPGSEISVVCGYVQASMLKVGVWIVQSPVPRGMALAGSCQEVGEGTLLLVSKAKPYGVRARRKGAAEAEPRLEQRVGVSVH